MAWQPFGLNTVKSFISGTPFSNIHTGNWGTPDIGLTEAVGSLSGASRTNQGGSNLFGGSYASSNNQGGQTLGTTSNYPGLTGNVPAGTQFGAPIGPPAPQGGGGGTSRLSQLSQTDRNPVQETEYQDLLRQQQGAAQSGADAELQAALSAFDYERENLIANRGQLGTERAGALSSLETALGRSQKQAETSKTEAEGATKTAKSKALGTAQDVQRSNRNVLRALGILSSSAAGEMLTRPMNEYASQAADLQGALVQRKNYIDTWLEERMSEHQMAVKDIENQYAQLVGNIDRDLRFNDRQRTDAVRQAQAALQQRMAEIQQSAQQYQIAAQQYGDQVLAQVAQLQMYQNPQADISGITDTLLSRVVPQGIRPSQIGITQDEQRRRTLSGLG